MPAWWVEISWLPRKGEEPNGVGYCLMVKSQIRPATLLTMANRAKKPAMLDKTGAFANGLNSRRSMAIPPAKESASVRMKAPQDGGPHGIICQDMKVENIAISPWAKLRWSIA